jgi:hypothetical protein
MENVITFNQPKSPKAIIDVNIKATIKTPKFRRSFCNLHITIPNEMALPIAIMVNINFNVSIGMCPPLHISAPRLLHKAETNILIMTFGKYYWAA